MYGKLEDEAPFGSVRRLIGYEDYALRLLDDDGFRIAKTYGVVELTPEPRVPAPDGVLRGLRDAGARGRERHDHRRRARLDQEALGRGPRAPGHQAREPARVRRPPAADRRLGARGATLAVAAGGGPRQHDAGDGPQVGPGSRLRDRAPVLHARGRRRGVRVRGRHGDPDRAPALPQGGRARPGRPIQGARASPRPGLDPALERAADRPHGGRGVRRRWWSCWRAGRPRSQGSPDPRNPRIAQDPSAPVILATPHVAVALGSCGCDGRRPHPQSSATMPSRSACVRLPRERAAWRRCTAWRWNGRGSVVDLQLGSGHGSWWSRRSREA